MPYHVTTFTLPCGTRCVRAEASGVVSKEDADYALTFIGPEGSMFGEPILVLTQKVKTLSPEARNLFGSRFDDSDKQAWSGVVVTSMVMRMVTNLVLRVSGNRKVKMFGGEEDAIRWLDERAREDAAKAKSKTT